MSIKILFTADNHIGISYNSFPTAKQELVKERLNSFARMVNYANENEVNFFIIGGDLFDKTNIADKRLQEIATILNSFRGELVLIIPGNHDFFEIAENSLWKKFQRMIDPEKVIVLSEYQVFDHQLNEKLISFFPAGCRSLHSESNMIGWVLETEKNKSNINIGIAHGNLAGLGLDEQDRYFNMTPQELSECGLDFWLLGHIHVPYPTQQTLTQNPNIFMAGTHMPDSWKNNHEGNAWFIEIDGQKNVSARKYRPSCIQFDEITHSLFNAHDLHLLQQKLNGYDKKNTGLKLSLHGNLDENTQALLQELIAENKREFIELDVTNYVGQKIDQPFINKLFANNSLPHTLLSELYEEDPDGDSVQKSLQILKRFQKSNRIN